MISGNHWWRVLSFCRISHIDQKTCAFDLCKLLHMIWINWYIRTEKTYIWLPYVVLTLMFDSNVWPNSAPLRDITFRNSIYPEFDLSRSLKAKCHGTTGLHIYSFLLMFNSNILFNSALFQNIRLWNLSYLDFHLSKSNMMVPLALDIYDFLLVFNSNIRPHWAPVTKQEAQKHANSSMQMTSV